MKKSSLIAILRLLPLTLLQVQKTFGKPENLLKSQAPGYSATYFGGSANESSRGIALDDAANIADLKIRNKAGQSPLDLANEIGDKELMALFSAIK